MRGENMLIVCKMVWTSCLIMIGAAWVFGFLVGCAVQTFSPLLELRQELQQMKADEAMQTKAPVALYDAEKAVKLAEETWQARTDETETRHLVYLAKRKIEITRYTAQRKMIDDELTQLKSDRDQLLLEGKDLEVQDALSKVQWLEAKLKQIEAETRVLTEQKQAALEAHNKSLEQQVQELKDLQAKKTERGLMLTLGDVWFEVGKAGLTSGAQYHLIRLVTILQQNSEINVLIEGYTDSVGSDDVNNQLSTQRAQAVANFLIGNGVSASRITSVGYGKRYPVASNDDPVGRQMNRRVELLLLNDAESSQVLPER